MCVKNLLLLGSPIVVLAWVCMSVFEGAMEYHYVGISDWKDRLVGFGSDDASANMVCGRVVGTVAGGCALGSYGLLFSTYWLELLFHDPLMNTHSTCINDAVILPVRKISPKCHQLDGIKTCFETDDFPHHRGGGTRALRACGTRFIAYKVAALNRLLGGLEY